MTNDMTRQHTMFRKITTRLFFTLALLLMGVSGVKAADYVFMYNGGYLAVNNSGNVTYTTDFSLQCIWTCVSSTTNLTAATLSTSDNYLYTEVNGTRYWLVDATTNGGEISVSNSANSASGWRNNDNRLYANSSNNSYYLYYRGNSWRTSRSSDPNYNNRNNVNYYNGYGNPRPDYRSTTYVVTSAPSEQIDNTVAPDIHINSVSGNTIEFDHGNDIGSYVPAGSFTVYTINGNKHNVYNNADWGTDVPQGLEVVPNSPSPSYTWSLTANGGGVATINSSTGVVTLSGAPTGNITVQVTVEYNVNTLSNKTSDEFTLTYASVNQSTSTNTTIEGLTLTPNPCTLDYQGSQTYTVSPTANKNTTTTPGHVTLTHGGTTYYYYDGAFQNAAPTGTTTTTHPAVTCSWSISGDGSSATTLSATTGNTTTVTYASVLSQDKGAILTVNATTDGATASATATINLNRTQPTSITPESSSLSICIGDDDIPFHYTLSPAGCYDHVTVTTSDANVARPHTTTAFSNGEVKIDAGNTAGTATLTLTAATGVTATVTVNVQPQLGLPIITFNNTTNTVTITSDEAGATIYYVTDGGTPTTSSASGTSPVTFTISSRADINAYATKTGYCSNASTFASKTILKVETPTLTVGSDGKVTMSCATTGATIRYTTDGTDPTTTTGTVYNAPVALPGGSTVKVIAVLADYINSDIYTTILQAPAATPVITITPSSTEDGKGDVTITCSTTGATIYYTTDGSTPDPTNAGGTNPTQQYTGVFTVGNGTTVKAIATATDYLPSEVATNRYMTASGVSGGIVTINDAEDHLWSYYSDPDCPVRSLSPADVKITYLGDGIVMTGNADYTASSTDFVKPGETNYTGGAKVNVGGENENTFIYYKTLERGDATQSAWTFSSGNQGSAASRCPYTPIPNPFQVRPTYGTPPNSDRAAWTGWRGFQCWRLKSVSGGSVYSGASGGTALSTGAVINAETEVYFAPNSEYGMTVDLEAVWSIAYIVYANGDGNWSVPDHSDKGYERNFVVLASAAAFNFGGNSGSKRISNINRESTITPYLPNGTSGNNAIGSIRGAYANSNAYNLTLQANTKFENVRFSDMTERTLTAAGHDLIIGRGCTGTVNVVRGINADVTSPNYTLRIESGTYNNLSILRGYGANTNAGTSTDGGSTLGGTPSVKAVFGCDYDRATNNGVTDNLIVSYNIYYASGVSENNLTYSENAVNAYIKSGKIGNSITINNNHSASAQYTVYMGGAANRLRGHRKLYLEGGEVASIAGGIDATSNQNNNSVTFRMTGGHVRGAVYGGGARSAGYGNRTFIITGGDIVGWVGGGCNGEAMPNGGDEDTYGGITYGLSKVYFGGTAVCGGTGSNVNINGSQGGIVFGAGKGVEGNTTSGRMSQGTTVVVADECDIERNVYGGGNFGYAQTSTDVYVSGGTVHGSVFGGSNQNNGPVINITMIGGQIDSGLYGGSNTTGTITSNVTMNINGGQVGVDENNTGNIHGGGYGSATVVTGNVDLTLGTTTQTTPGVIVYGDVYGGSALGQVNGTSVDASKHTNVTLNKGAIHGSLYGGALGDASTAANVYAPVTVIVNGGSVTLPDQSAGVFGCNNVNGAPKSTVTVTVNDTDEEGVDNVFGGGNHADYTPPAAPYNYPTVDIKGGMVNNSVFGGGNEADILGNANVTMTGGTVQNRVFGGGNLGSVGTYTHTTTSITGHTSHTGCIGWPAATSAWTKGGKCTVTISGGKVGRDNMMMPQDYGHVFGASRGETKDPAIDPDIEFRAYVKETEVTISGTAFILGGVYGGSENGHVKGDTWVKIQENCQIGCGEGKTTPYTAQQWADAATAVKTGDASGIIAAAAAMPECSHWNYQAPYHVYDPNNATPGGSTTGNDGHTFYGNVFGGGSGYWPYEIGGDGLANGYEWLESAGQVEGSTKVEITGGHILTSVYGGNELTSVTGDSCVVIMTGGTLGVPRTVTQTTSHPVTCYLFGAGKGDPRPYFNERTNVENTRVEVGGTAMIYGSIFGGAEDGHVKGNAKIDVWGNNSHIGTWGSTYVDGNVFGAGRGFSGEALASGVVQGNVLINIQAGTMLGSIYGGGRLGSVGTYLVPENNANYGKLITENPTEHGNITVNISGGTIGNTYEYIVPTGDWTQAWKETNNIHYTEFGSADTDKNRLMHTKGGNVFAGCMGRLFKLDGTTVIPNWPDMGKARKTVLDISGGTIKSNVYGGGELGAVEEGTKITIRGGIIGTEVPESGDVKYTFGSVFGGGYGSDRNVTGTLRSVVNARDYAGLVTGDTDIDITGGHVWASVYGGGELARVAGSTDVNISGNSTEIGKNQVDATTHYVMYGGYRMGNVFGGGKGSLDYTAAGEIMGNATVTISSGKIYHNVYGGGALGSVGTYTVDSGTGATTCTSGTGTTTVRITGGQIGINGYDNGMVNGSSRGADGDPKGSNLDNVAWVNNSFVYIGTEGQGTDFANPIVYGAVYGGGENGHNYGNSQVNIYSGTVGNTDPAATWQHGHVYGAGCGTDDYTYNGETYYNPMAGIIHGTATLNIKGGHIVKAAYGGGALGTTEGKATVNVTGGRIGSVYGGPKGKEGAKAENNAKFAYCGVEADVNIDYPAQPTTDDGSTTQLILGSVFGGGEAGTVEGDVVVNMKKGLVLGDLYGGGALADTNIDNAQYYGQSNETIASTATHKTTVNLTGGIINGNVYGGALGRKASATETANPAYVYGDVLVELNKTIATDNCVVKGTIFGANNYNGSPKGEVKVHVYKTVDVDGSGNVKSKPTKNTNTYELKAVYGGGNEAAYIPIASSTQTANVIIEGCSLTSIETVYGGGNAASVPGTHVVVNSCYEIGTVFGGGNGKDALSDGSLNYGAHVGYKPLNYTTNTSLSDEANYAAYQTAFEAQKASLTYGSGEAKVDALGGTIHKIFGGSNTRGNVRKESVAFIDQSNDECPLKLDEVYGGGNEAFMDGNSSVKLGCISYLETIYGGANAADVGGDIELTITSGRFNRVFGGNNQSGTINGSIKVNIEETGCHPIVIGELYGCGNQAPYTKPAGKNDPEINIRSFTSIGRVFGGGLGAPAIVTGSPTVNINEVLGAHDNGSVTAGSYTYDVPTYFDADGNFKETTLTIGGTQITIPAHTKGTIGAIGTVFGGGNAAKISGNTNVNIGTLEYIPVTIPIGDSVTGLYTRSGAGTDASPYVYTELTSVSAVAVANTTYYKPVVGANITGNVFGGGNQAEVTGNTNVEIGAEKVTAP